MAGGDRAHAEQRQERQGRRFGPAPTRQESAAELEGAEERQEAERRQRDRREQHAPLRSGRLATELCRAVNEEPEVLVAQVRADAGELEDRKQQPGVAERAHGGDGDGAGKRMGADGSRAREESGDRAADAGVSETGEEAEKEDRGDAAGAGGARGAGADQQQREQEAPDPSHQKEAGLRREGSAARLGATH